jgi:antitoxin component of MazEF toxin-antitoxin module
LSDEEFIPLAVRRVSRKGGSLSITIPIEIVNMLCLKPDDNLVFLYNKNKRNIIIDKATSTFTTSSGLSFSISKELAKKLLKEEEDGRK